MSSRSLGPGSIRDRSLVSGALMWLFSIASIIASPAGAHGAARPFYEAALQDCRIVDGDTIRCGSERIRLLGIDAPELPGHCRPGRRCAPGDPFASTASLAEAIAGRLRAHRVGQDRYGRTLALVSGGRGDLSCWQVSRGRALYKPNWDDGRQLSQLCPAAR